MKLVINDVECKGLTTDHLICDAGNGKYDFVPNTPPQPGWNPAFTILLWFVVFAAIITGIAVIARAILMDSGKWTRRVTRREVRAEATRKAKELEYRHQEEMARIESERYKNISDIVTS